MTAVPGTLRHFRRTAVALAAWSAVVVAALVVTGTPAHGRAEFSPGTGTAIAQNLRVDPRQGGLSFGLTSGLSIAGHQNTVAQGDSRAIDLGVIGTVLAGEGCDGGDPTLPSDQQPQAVQVRSGDPDAASGQTSNEIPSTTQFARATDDPFGEAVTTTAGFGVPGVLEVGPGIATATSGVVANGVREARATTEYGRISLAGGAVVLNGLRWEAVQRTGSEKLSDGTFAIDALSLAGVPVPVSDAATAFDTVNSALRLLGFELELPDVRVVEGVVFVEPMRIAIIPADLRDDLLGPIFEAGQPVREQLFEQLIAMDCGNSTYVTVADIALGTVTAAGSIALELGGVQATTAAIDFFRFDGLSAPPALAPPAAPQAPAPIGPVTTTTATTLPTAATPTTLAPVADEQALPLPAPTGTRGGLMAAVAAAGLLLVGALGEGDRRKMRRAQRMMPLETA